MNIVVEGKAGIRVEVVLDSISEAGKRITTFLVDHPRIVHAEELKHRMFSFSAASSRAIPFNKMTEQLTGKPVRFGGAQAGMQDNGEHDSVVYCDYNFNGVVGEFTKEAAWQSAKQDAVKWAKAFADAGFHKQVYNRLTEPFQMIRVLVTATETDNFFWLRNDAAADPTLQEQARCMYEAMQQSEPTVLKAGEWHLPFVEYMNTLKEFDADDNIIWGDQEFYVGSFEDNTVKMLTLDEAIKVSCARCAAISFRNTDYDLEKSLQVYDRLVNGDKVHAGALEHCASPMEDEYEGSPCGPDVNISLEPHTWQEGISHMDKQGNLWSGNFKGWIQFRKTIPNECYNAPKENNV